MNRERLLICVGHHLPKLFRFGAGRLAWGHGSGSNRRSRRLSVGKLSRTIPVFTNPHPLTLVASS